MQFRIRTVEQGMVLLLIVMCGYLLISYWEDWQTLPLREAYRLQEAYNKVFLTDRARLLHLESLEELIPVIRPYVEGGPLRRLHQIALAPGGSIEDGTAFFLALPNSSRFDSPAPPSVSVIRPVSNTRFAFGQSVPIRIELGNNQQQVFFFEIYANNTSAGQLACVDGVARGVWHPQMACAYDLLFVAKNALGGKTLTIVTNVVIEPADPGSK